MTKNLLKSHSEVKNVTFLTLLAADKAFSASMATGTVRILQITLNFGELLESSKEKYILIYIFVSASIKHAMCCDQIFERILSWREFKIFKFSISIL